MSDLSAIGFPSSNPLSNGSTAGTLASLGVSGDFSSVVNQMLSNPSSITPQNAQLAVAQAQNADNLALSGMFSDSSSSLLGMGASGLLGGGDLFALPSWASQAASLSGDSNIQALLSMYNQEASLVQSQLLGGSSSVFDGLV